LNGRSISLWPHGILFRDSEADMRRKMIESDVAECVIGLGPNLFYNSSMVSCLLVCRNNKPKNRKNKILFIDAVDEVRKEKTMSYLDTQHILKILKAYQKFETIPGFSEVVEKNKVLEDKIARLSVQFFVQSNSKNKTNDFYEILNKWEDSSVELKKSMDELFKTLA
jgi:type I restriction enzyme M protein